MYCLILKIFCLYLYHIYSSLCCIVRLLYSSLPYDVIGNVDRGLRLIRAKSGDISSLLELELLEPWPVRCPLWFPMWANDSCRRLEQRLQQQHTAEVRGMSPTRVVTSDAAAQASGSANRLQPPH